MINAIGGSQDSGKAGLGMACAVFLLCPKWNKSELLTQAALWRRDLFTLVLPAGTLLEVFQMPLPTSIEYMSGGKVVWGVPIRDSKGRAGSWRRVVWVVCIVGVKSKRRG